LRRSAEFDIWSIQSPISQFLDEVGACFEMDRFYRPASFPRHHPPKQNGCSLNGAANWWST
jgi:hypothetical protein